MLILLLTAPAPAADLRLEATLHGPGEYGSAVASGDIDGDGFTDLLVGSFRGKTAFVHYGGAGGLRETADLELPGEAMGHGQALALLDLDGDGYDDAFVGAYGESLVHWYHGGADGLDPEPDHLSGADGTGAIVAAAGDVDRDGYDDLLIGADPIYGVSLWVIAGGDFGPSGTWPLRPTRGDALMNVPARGAGDVDGDGFDDIVTASPLLDAPWGELSAFAGSPEGLPESPSWVVGAPDPAPFPIEVAAAGDVDGDGFADVLARAWGAGGFGIAYVLPGSADGPSVPVPIAQEDGVPILGSVGDLDLDGFDDVGLLWCDAGEGGATVQIVVYRGSAAGVGPEPWMRTEREERQECYAAIGSAGDIDGDGIPEMYAGIGQAVGGEVRIYGLDELPEDPPDPGDTDEAGDTDEGGAFGVGMAAGGHGCSCSSPGGLRGASAALLLLVSAAARARSSRPAGR